MGFLSNATSCSRDSGLLIMTTKQTLREISEKHPKHIRSVLIRFGGILFLCLVAFVTRLIGVEFSLQPLFVLLCLASLANLISLGWVVSEKQLPLRIYYAIFADFLLITIAVHYLGGIEAPVFWIYAIALFAIALMHGLRIGVYAAIVASLLYSSLLIGEFFGIIKHVGFGIIKAEYLRDDNRYLVEKLLFDNILIFLSVSVSGFLTERWRHSEQKLKASRDDLKENNKQLRQEIDERLQAQEALERSEEHHRLLADNVRDVIWTMNIEKLRFTYVSPSVTAQRGYTVEEAMAQTLDETLTPASLETAMRSLAGELAPENVQSEDSSWSRTLELEQICKNRHTILTEVTVTFLRDPGGQPVELLGVSRDIMARKQTENRLAESLSLIRATLESTPDGILVVDTKGNMQSYNQRFLEMWTIPEQLIEPGDNPEARLHILNQAKYPEKVVQDTEEVYDHPDRENYHILELKDGRTFERHTRPRKNGDVTTGIVISFHDITERRRGEKLLRKSEEKYRTLFEESIDVVYVSTPEGRLLDINPAGIELLGYSSKSEVLEIDVANTYANPVDREEFQEIMARDGSVKDFELCLRRRDGRQVDVLVTANVVSNDRGEVVAYRGMMRDITHQKQLQQQLIQAQKMESIGTLAGGIAHDFNNLLGGILGFASLAKSKVEDHHQITGYLDTIEASATRAAELTSQLLAFARGGRYQVKPINVNNVVDETMKIVRRTFDKSIEFKTILSSQLPAVEADAGQIQQVLLNLCVNAKDAMDGGGMLTIETGAETLTDKYAETHIEAGPGTYVTLSVSDSGVGIGKKALQKIFEPFFTTKKEGKGTGLGLAMVYGVIKNHGGFVNVYSKLYVGSTFKVYLPASSKPEAKDTPKPEAPGTGDELILVVDDDESMRSLTKEILETRGYEVLLAEDGVGAVEVYEKMQQEISLVILDMVMPIMGGREAFMRLREINPEVKAILSTGYSQSGKAQQILDSGVMGFIQKPFQPNALLSEVRILLDGDR